MYTSNIYLLKSKSLSMVRFLTILFCTHYSTHTFADNTLAKPTLGDHGLSNCRFNYGQDWLGTEHTYPDNLNYIRTWLGTSNDLDNTQRSMFKSLKKGGILEGRTPMVIDYLIAFTARANADLQDCDVADSEGRSTSLCTHGTQFIRENKQLLLDKHRRLAKQIANAWGTSEPILWMTEPDYFQYAVDEDSQIGGGFSYSEAGQHLRDFLNVVKEELPNVVFALDTAPWLRERAARWFKAMPLDMVSYLSLFGKPTALIQNGSWSNSWQEFHQLTGLPILSEGWEYNDPDNWHNSDNINRLIGWGVISESFRVPPVEWGDIIANNAPKLVKSPTCSQN